MTDTKLLTDDEIERFTTRLANGFYETTPINAEEVVRACLNHISIQKKLLAKVVERVKTLEEFLVYLEVTGALKDSVVDSHFLAGHLKGVER